MGDFSIESDSWPIEDYLEQGQFPTSSLEWTERDPADWFKSEPLCESEPRLLSPPDSPRFPSPVQSQEENKGGDNALSSFKFSSCPPPTSAASTVTNNFSNLLSIYDVARARSDSRSDHRYSRDEKCLDFQGREAGGGTAPPDWPGPITSRAATRHSTEPPLVIGRHTATQPTSDPL